jgi:hypothetical protein
MRWVLGCAWRREIRGAGTYSEDFDSKREARIESSLPALPEIVAFVFRILCHIEICFGILDTLVYSISLNSCLVRNKRQGLLAD